MVADEESATEAPEGETAKKTGGAFVLRDDDEDDAPAQQVSTAGATADPVKDYLKQIGKVALLNAEQEVELAKRIEAGLFAEEKLHSGDEIDPIFKRELWWISEDGRRAKNHLLEANLRLVVSLAKRYTAAACSSWTSSRRATWGSSVRSRSSTTHKGLQVLDVRDVVDPPGHHPRHGRPGPHHPHPVHMVEVINKLARVQRQMLQDLGREPTPEELAKELDMTPEKVVEVQKYGREPISLHTPWARTATPSSVTSSRTPRRSCRPTP